MSNVKRYQPLSYMPWAGDDGTGMVEHPRGLYVEFTDYERLRDALEILAAKTCSCVSSIEENWHHKTCFKLIAIKALAPAAGSLEEADAPKAARKEGIK